MNKFLLGMTGVAALFMATGANAALSIKVDDLTSGESVQIDDGSALDSKAATGQILASVATTNFDALFESGAGSAFLTFPEIFDIGVFGKFTNDATMSFSISENDLSGFDAAMIDAGLTTASSIGGSWSLYGGNSNDLYDSSAANLLATSDLDGISSWADFSSSIPADGKFSLTLVGTFTGMAGNSISVDTQVVPEPSILALFGAGLIGFGVARRKMKK
jgi:hypothetical protein